MIQFNLLPDVKKEYVKAKRTRRLMVSTSLLVSAASIGIVLLMFFVVQVAQKKNISDLSKDIEDKTTAIKSTDDLETILTVQNQLSLLTQLHETKPETSRVFSMVTFISPPEVKLDSLNLDVESSTIGIAGRADTLATIYKFVENIKATEFAVSTDIESRNNLFSDIDTTLSGDDEIATFDIEMAYSPEFFDNKVDIFMSVGSGQELIRVTGGEDQEGGA